MFRTQVEFYTMPKKSESNKKDTNPFNEIEKIKERNARVEADKAWEGSWVRRITIAVLTYVIISTFFVIMYVPNPFMNALVPTMGFLLSTLTLTQVKKYWIETYNAKK